MFSPDFYPTPPAVIEEMLQGLDLTGKVVLEPSAGSGNLVRAIQAAGAKEVIACENDPQLVKIAQTYCKIVEKDFLNLTSDRISHIDFIVMNPPFSRGAEHIVHAYEIAPPGCKVIALCNAETVKNPYSKTREQLQTILENYGQHQELGKCFDNAERKTGVEVVLIRLEKPGNNYGQEFAGFFMDEDPEEQQANGLMSYNAVRDLVNRYVESVKIYDQQLETAVRLNELQQDYFDTSSAYNDSKGAIAITMTVKGQVLARNEFKKRMQKSGWKWIFDKMNLNKHSTKGLREDINKFVERQQDVPFTMRNIYHMLDMVIQTTGQRMDKAIIEVFDKITRHSHDNEFRVEGWKTNSHYLLTKRFIAPSYCKEEMEDMVKALCYITGENYDHHMSLEHRMNNKYTLVDAEGKLITEDAGRYYNYYLWSSYEIENYGYGKQALEKHPGSKIQKLEWEYGKWFDWGFFNVRHYKKGTYHFEFKSDEVWAKFNQHVARIKGYPLPEKKEQTKYQERQNGRKAAQPAYKPTAQKAKVLFTINL